jgi:hypothetical protein
MNGIIIQYQYSGDEAAWEKATRDFVAALEADRELEGGFMYMVSKANESDTRTHVGRWRDDETLKLMQSRDYFKSFAGILKEMADGTLKAEGMSVSTMTAQ